MSNQRRTASFCVVLFTLLSYHHSSLVPHLYQQLREPANEIVPVKMSTSLDGLRDSMFPLSDRKELHQQDSIPDMTTSEERITASNNTDREDEFLPENIGWPTRVPCGSQKCFYQLKSNRQIGYLVAPQTKSGRMSLLESGYLLAKQLERDFNMTHFLLGPPTEHIVSSNLAKRLNRNFYIERTRKMQTGSKAKRFPKASTILTQKVKLAPRRHLLFGCVDSKIQAFKKTAPKFLQHIRYKESFMKNLHESLALTKRLLKHQPSLFKDFQVMLDMHGQLHHLDFDRVFSSSGKQFHMPKTFEKSCLRKLQRVELHFRRALKQKR